jgi:hypothetical protein
VSPQKHGKTCLKAQETPKLHKRTLKLHKEKTPEARASKNLKRKVKRGEIMQIQVDVPHEVWQKFCLLCTGKDPTAVLTEMVENAWGLAHPENKKLRGE